MSSECSICRLRDAVVDKYPDGSTHKENEIRGAALAGYLVGFCEGVIAKERVTGSLCPLHRHAVALSVVEYTMALTKEVVQDLTGDEARVGLTVIRQEADGTRTVEALVPQTLSKKGSN